MNNHSLAKVEFNDNILDGCTYYRLRCCHVWSLAGQEHTLHVRLAQIVYDGIAYVSK